MNIIISGKQMELTEGIKNTIQEKLGRLDIYIQPDDRVNVTVSAKKSRQTIEVTVIPINGPIIRAEDSEENLYAAIDVVYDKLNMQLRKLKNRLLDRHQDVESIRYNGVEKGTTIDYEQDSDEDDFEEIVIQRHKKFDIKPMNPEEAVLQMNLLQHDFYMFRNIETDEMSLVYKRKNGGYGMIEHE
ncbi:ribosome hibernation-promoting factor, HPF/YfiA family [[Clostridium] dakarense]|uniref:ribosome hibernation-promoting factor, HPF/YfiA family n=1 Tax=Faecalimicrobium dakarense TaxID=1301100 RepID=UPI0004B3847D|nr:ribosome-associated translation inhibitor RaiA [[Clostridium] dakarense]